MTNSDKMKVTGRIVSLEDKTTYDGVPFCMVDLATFYGPNIRFQAWGNAYEYIKRNQLRADSINERGDYLEVEGYTHVYNFTNNQGRRSTYVTFKTQNVKRPTATVQYTGNIEQLEHPQVFTLSTQSGFTFKPDVVCSGVEMPLCHCVIEKTNPDYEKISNKAQFLGKKPKCTIIGEVDNTDKKVTKILVTSLTLEEE